jgi:superfamily II DNA or RNA helicase
MDLKHLSEHAVLGPTMAIPVSVLDTNWSDSDWYKGLTVTPLSSSVANRAPPPIRTGYVRDGWLHLPRFRGVELVGMGGKDRRSLGEPMNPEVTFGGTLKPNQTEATSKVMDQMGTIGGAMLVLPCGFGKTVCSIWIMSQLGRRTLVLVHTGALADQWEDRISTFLPGSRVGRIQQDVVRVDGCDVVIGMIQSLVKRDYGRDLRETFGTVVIDEAHHIAAPYFSGGLRKISAKYVVGLSATPDRKDGLGAILPWMMGPIAFRAHREAEDVKIHLIDYVNPSTQVELVDRRGKPRYAEMLTSLSMTPDRNDRIIGLIRSHVGSGRCLIVLSERRDQLLELERLLLEEEGAVSLTTMPPRKRRRKNDPPPPPLDPPPQGTKMAVARVMGGTTNELRDHGFEHFTVLLSTYPYASEGIDIPRLDTLVMASPGINVEQTVGRILRKHPSKQVPLVVDIRDPFSLFGGMGWKRYNYYSSQNYSFTKSVWEV